MADSADVKPKLLSNSEIDNMVAKQELLKQATPDMMYKSGHPGSMKRPSKLFIKVDREGLLTDTIAISDVVDFDCYESIVSSACRIIACFQSAKPENIEVESLFYYKKRARSTRMNPVMIKSTTDAFKAVAEHPVGEVPIGVRWTQKYKYKLVVNPDNSVTKLQDITKQTKEQPTKATPNKQSEDLEDGVPEKKRKLLEEIQKSQSEVKNQMQNATSHISPFNQAYPVISSEAFKANKTVLIPNVISVKPVPDPILKSSDDAEPGEIDPGNLKYMPREALDPEYMFPKGAKTELVVTYGDGVVEKRKIPEEVSKVVNMMLKGNYSFLTREALMALSLGGNACQTGDKNEEKATYQTRVSTSGMPEFENSKPIKYIKDAKSEIFRTLSMLSVSKTRFKSLLKWMKTLKLEEGKKGKFYLSARDVIGGTKYVISSAFETDEQNVLKHDQAYKPYGSTVQSNGPNVNSGTDSSAKIGMPAIPEPPHNQIMFLMPSSSIPSSATPVFKTSAGVTMVPTTKVIHMPVQATQSQPALSMTVTNSNTESVPSFTNAPPILRRRPRKSLQPSRSRDASPNPIPMNLYRSYHAGEEDRLSPLSKSSAEKDNSLTVKVEPHDYDSETSDATVDYDRNSEREGVSPRPGGHTDTFLPESSVYADGYDKRKVLKSDAAMPQSTETDRPFDIVIKSEPLDDYE